MPSYAVETTLQKYPVAVERGILSRLGGFVPSGSGKVFVVTTKDVWEFHGERIAGGLQSRFYRVLYYPGGEDRKRLSSLEELAEQMVEHGADRSSLVIAFGGGIVTDVGGFLAAVFMRGIPLIQVPTTLVAQVDAGIGGKTGVNLASGKNLIGSFHQPLAVLVDPAVLDSLPEREYRAGLYEVIKHGVIRSAALFQLLARQDDDVLSRKPEVVEEMIAESVRIKTEVVSADERESGLRRILNFGHTFGHALEAETGYTRFLHGEAVAWGMKAATLLSGLLGRLSSEQSTEIIGTIAGYGPIPSLEGIEARNLVARMQSDKKTLQGKVHFVLPDAIGRVSVVSGIDESRVLAAVEAALV